MPALCKELGLEGLSSLASLVPGLVEELVAEGGYSWVRLQAWVLLLGCTLGFYSWVPMLLGRRVSHSQPGTLSRGSIVPPLIPGPEPSEHPP